MRRAHLIALGLCLPFLAGCVASDLDFDLRPDRISTRGAGVAAPRPAPDANGLLTYESYQVVVARRGDTVAGVAARIGMDADELARFNGRQTTDVLRADEILALPRRVTPGATAAPGGRDIAAIASGAIDAAEARQTLPRRPCGAGRRGTCAPPGGARRDRLFGRAALQRIGALAGGMERARPRSGGPRRAIPDHPAGDRRSPAHRPHRAGHHRAAATPLLGDAAARTDPASHPAPARHRGRSPGGSTDPAPTAAPSARFIMPVSGSIIRPYGRGNEGIDIGAATGTPVRAAADGEVAAITRDTDQIPILVVRHSDGLLTVYANIRNISVARGDRVTQGQILAEVGPGDPSFLHFEVRRGFEAVNPTQYLP